MAFNTRANDWEVAGVAQVGGAAIIGGGAYWFDFYSKSAGVHEMFAFFALTIGAGGSIGGGSLTPTSRSPIKCDCPFSAADLNFARGRISMAGVSAGVGYAQVYITAWTWSPGVLFTSQSASGWGAGMGAQALTSIGLWRSMQRMGADAERGARR